MFLKVLIFRSANKQGRHLRLKSQVDRCHGFVNPDSYKEYQNMSLNEVLLIDNSEVVVNAVGELPITVEEIKRVATSGRFLNDTAVAAAIRQINPLIDHSPSVLHYLTVDLDLYSMDDVISKYGDEYLRSIQGKDIILVPINDGAHYTLAAIRLDCSYIELYNSYWYKTPFTSRKFEQVKAVIERLCDVSLKTIIKTDLPCQNDGDSCGIYTILFAQHAIAGQNLDGIDDEDIKTFRQEIATLLLTKPFKYDFDLNPRESAIESTVETAAVDDFNMDIEETEEMNTDVADLPVLQMLGSLSVALHKPKINPSFRDSVELCSVTSKPFRGYNQKSDLITYNTRGLWSNMLSVTEMVNHFSPGNPREGRKILKAKLSENPAILRYWLPRMNRGNAVYNIHQFSFDSDGNYRLIANLYKQFNLTPPVNHNKRSRTRQNKSNVFSQVISFSGGECFIISEKIPGIRSLCMYFFIIKF